jgi:hypothetical protein
VAAVTAIIRQNGNEGGKENEKQKSGICFGWLYPSGRLQQSENSLYI